MPPLTRFLEDETGAISVEYAVLCAVTAGLGVAMMAGLKAGTADAGSDIAANSKYSAQIVQPRVRTIYDQGFMSGAYDAMGVLSEEELAVLTAWFDDLTTTVAADPGAYGTETIQAMHDVNTALDLSWSDMNLDRPTDATWTQEQLNALPGGTDYLTY